MSDRTRSSVRTGARGDGEAAVGESGPEAPVTSTQSIPGASTPRSQGSVPTGSQAVAPAVEPSVPSVAGPPSVPPTTGSSPAAGSAAATGSSPAAAAGSAAVAGSSPAAAAGASPAAAAGASPAATAAGKRGRGSRAGGRGPRRARLQLRHIDLWSAFKISFVLSIAMFFIWMVAVGILYGVLNALGVFTTLNTLFGQLGDASGSEVAGDVVTPGLVLGGAAVIGAINIVLMTALCTVATFIYNLCSDLVGGLELTLSERD